MSDKYGRSAQNNSDVLFKLRKHKVSIKEQLNKKISTHDEIVIRDILLRRFHDLSSKEEKLEELDRLLRELTELNEP